MDKVILITGTSTGFGRTAAETRAIQETGEQPMRAMRAREFKGYGDLKLDNLPKPEWESAGADDRRGRDAPRAHDLVWPISDGVRRITDGYGADIVIDAGLCRISWSVSGWLS